MYLYLLEKSKYGHRQSMHADLCGSRKFFFNRKRFKKKLLTAESVGGCWLSLYVQLRCISITLQYLKIEIDKSELSAPPPPRSRPSPSLYKICACCECECTWLFESLDHWYHPPLFPLHFVCMNSSKPLRFRNI